MPPWVKMGTVRFTREVDSSLLPGHFATLLRSVDARGVKLDNNQVEFKGGVFRLVHSWNVLNPFGFGTLKIDAQSLQICYRLNYGQFVLFATALLALMSLFILSSIGWRYLFILPVAWLWLVGGNLIIGISRFEGFIGRALLSAPKRRPEGLAR